MPVGGRGYKGVTARPAGAASRQRAPGRGAGRAGRTGIWGELGRRKYDAPGVWEVARGVVMPEGILTRVYLL